MKWEVTKDGEKWTDSFETKEAAEAWAEAEREKIPCSVFEVREMGEKNIRRLTDG